VIYLCCYIASSIAFHQLFRFGQQKKTDVLSTAAVNYSVAAVLTVAWYLIAGHGEVDIRLVVYGLCNGTVYYVSLPLLLRAFQLAGVGVTVAVLSTSNLSPVIFAFLAWDEPVTNMQWIALALVPVAIFLLRPRDGGIVNGGVKADVLLVLLFIMGSLMMTTHKAASRIVENDSELLYNACVFVAAMAVSVGYALYARLRVTKFDCGLGLGIGVANMLNIVFLLLCLGVMSTAIVFTTAGTVVISLNLAVSWLLWKEAVDRRQALGIMLAILVVVLTNFT
jgi:drug/metabolite transporter (DMT)-like permease